MFKPFFTLLSMLFLSVNLMAQDAAAPIKIQEIGDRAEGKQSIHLLFEDGSKADGLISESLSLEDDDGFLRLYLAWAYLIQEQPDEVDFESVRSGLEDLVSALLKNVEAFHEHKLKNPRASFNYIAALELSSQKLKDTNDLMTYVTSISLAYESDFVLLLDFMGKHLNRYKEHHVYKVPHYILGAVSFYSLNKSVSQILKGVAVVKDSSLSASSEGVPRIKFSSKAVQSKFLNLK